MNEIPVLSWNPDAEALCAQILRLCSYSTELRILKINGVFGSELFLDFGIVFEIRNSGISGVAHIGSKIKKQDSK